MKFRRNLAIKTLSLHLLVMLMTSFLLVSYGNAQSSTAQILGTVTDSTGAVIPGATVTVTNRATNVSREVKSSSSGAYVVTQLIPGPYTVKVAAPGFATTIVSVEALQVNQALDQSIALKPGSESMTVEVSATSEMMQTATSEVGVVIDPEQVHDIPLNGRNFTTLINLAPGAGPVATSQSAHIGFGPISSVGIPGSTLAQPALQGQWNRMNFYTLDGAINSSAISSSYVVLPMIDSIQEFKVQSHSDNAEFGGVLGGVVNVVTKPGGNTFHGAGWEYVRNTAFDARTTLNVNHLNQNQYGGLLSGPVWIPKLYKGKDRTFFTFGYEGWRYNSNLSAHYATVPTAAELTGDFSHALLTHDISGTNPAPCAAPPVSGTTSCTNVIYDPTQAPRTAFSGNKIPSGRINQLALKYIQTYFDVPNFDGNTLSSPNPRANDLIAGNTINNDDTYNVRIDERLNEHNNIFFRYTRMNYIQTVPDTNKMTSQAIEHPVNYAIGFNHLFTTSLLSDFHFGYAKLNYAQADLPNAGVPDIQSGGFGSLVNPGYPAFSIEGQSGIGGSDSPGTLDRYAKNFSASGNLSYMHGRHELRVGVQFFMVGYANGTGNTSGNTVYNFNNPQTSDGSFTDSTGNGLASALLGYPAQVSTSAQHFNLKYRVYAPYVQDRWKITPKLTINIGFRVDYFSSPYLTNHGLLSEFDPNTGNYTIASSTPLAQCVPAAAPCIPTGTAYTQATGNVGMGVSAANHIAYANPSDLMPHSTAVLGPRFGLAYAMTPKLAIRAGFGIVGDTLSGVLQTIQANVGTWPDSSQANTLYNPTSPTTVPTTTLDSATKNQGSALPGPNPFNSGNWMYDPKMRNPYSEQWNLEIQQQLTNASSVTLAYVGSNSKRLPISGHFNTGTPGSNGANRPFPYEGPTEMAYGKGWSNFHAFEAHYQARLSRSLNMLSSYTYSKSLDVGSGYFAAENNGPSPQWLNNLAGEYGPSAYDVTHNLTVGALYELPFGKNQPFLNDGIASKIFGGFKFNTTTSMHSGTPLTVTVPGDVAQICGPQNCIFGIGYERANMTGSPKVSGKSPQHWFNTAAFSTPATGTFGTSSRGVIRSPGAVYTDVSLFRSVRIRDKATVQLRAESFNFVNHLNLGSPDTNINDGSAFGTITSNGGTPREFQFGARVEF
ncbi:MAG: TonB-dependent receptor [Acidobacteriota bacterium]|nr:TonB-dependent receptor [Acidobacteriota bacterium]